MKLNLSMFLKVTNRMLKRQLLALLFCKLDHIDQGQLVGLLQEQKLEVVVFSFNCLLLFL